MLEKPDIPDARIIAHLREACGVEAAGVAFLPLGADVNTAVYRVAAADGANYFLKLRRGAFDAITVAVSRFLSDQGVATIIPPLPTRAGILWAEMDDYTTILYPFVEGRDGYEIALSDAQWIAFGAAVRRIHATRLPPELAERLPDEDFSPRWRDAVRGFQAQAEEGAFDDPVAARLAAFMRSRRDEIAHMVARADRLGDLLRSQARETVLCHGDLHAGNLLIAPGGALYIVDWDNPIYAPRERDLLLIGGDGVGAWNGARAERWFYQGYGPVEIDPVALAYYRYERIITDIAEFCEQLLLSAGGGDDREQSYRYFTGQFEPGHEVDVARRTDGA